jgi:endonuclease YncB( thermonuclease family)
VGQLTNSEWPRVVRAALLAESNSRKPFERFDGGVVEPDEWTDGDSFRVRLPDGQLETFRLYYVDTTESRSRGKRSDEQAAYFGITLQAAVELGKDAKKFTARAWRDPSRFRRAGVRCLVQRATTRSCSLQRATIWLNFWCAMALPEYRAHGSCAPDLKRG